MTSSTDPKILAEAALRRAMLTAVTLLVLFTVFVQVRKMDGWVGGWVGGREGGREGEGGRERERNEGDEGGGDYLIGS